jgi:hypothetical protein
MNLNETINKYNELYNSPRIQEINALLKGDIERVDDKIDELHTNIEKSLRMLFKTKLHKEMPLKNIIYIKDYGERDVPYKSAMYNNSHWSAIKLLSEQSGSEYLISFSELFEDKYKTLRKQISELDDNIKTIIDTSEPFYKQYYDLDNIFKTRKKLGVVTGEMIRFFSTPARTKIGSQMNLIINTTCYGTNIRIPAIHYWNMCDREYKRVLTKYNNTILLKDIFYDEIKAAITEHTKTSNIKKRQILKDIKLTNDKLLKYFVLAKINGGDDE